ncbi:ABC transporter permease subunit [Pseudalkalibacillus hwajinpoensis]|uniref:ABC transporter permease n=1 Tax=Guptibacillus hwajinpoensis TaxID=208199 RepID=UPI00325A7D4C
MLRNAMKNPMFVVGLIVIVGLFSISMYYYIVHEDHIPKTFMFHNDEGQLIDRAPLSPIQVGPFGTDKLGYHLFEQIIIGAKYTIGIAFLVASMRMALSFVGGVLGGTYLQKTMRTTSGIVDAMQYIPISLLSYFILRGVLMENGMDGTFQYSFFERMVFEVVILTAVAIPTTTVLISNETYALWGKEFIESARTLGGTRIHILVKHILPHLGPRMIIIFLQQLVSVLILLLHLGLLKLFFGGTFFSPDPVLGDEYRSVSAEWSGLIGSTYEYLAYETWVPLIPILSFVLVILAVHVMLEGFKQSMESQSGKRNKKRQYSEKQADVNPNSFYFLNEIEEENLPKRTASR